jgi:hypothetical protein
MLFRTLLTLFIATLLLQACYNDKADQLYPAPLGGCDTTGVTYSGFVSQVVGSSTCSKNGCHVSASASGNVTLDNYAGVKAVALDGRLMGAISDAPGYPHMPQDAGKLDACVIAKIGAWVAQGAPQN